MEAVILENLSDGTTMVSGKLCMTDAKGHFVPVNLIKPADKLQDEVVRKVMGYADDISAQIARFRAHTMEDLDGYDQLLDQEYGVKVGGKKGNRTYQSFDGLLRVQVAVNDFIDFGPQLQTAKLLIDEYLNELTADSPEQIQALITEAFNTAKAGKIDVAGIKKLKRLQIEDPRWKDAMRAIEDAERVNYSKQYVRFYRRASIEDQWQAVTVDLAKS
ncbi:hypothetical protein PDO_1912 [Rhizobium sp. PDO1-076]|uniref:DUF3164 family protein n=1 Tax=Rhizobium sp. PDO1-076 TaxID=1125979 RepID=UPI00024E35D9|nr:DUF3164 family protein [Rhizobium sp. PDO1-076]EHS51521.1 hypothetical protein PDO_1912 [Rhizobium sp. PDO1-076]